MTATNPPPTHGEHCPIWCVVDHQPDDHPDDRWHDSAMSYVDVVVRLPDSTEASELTIVTSRRFGDVADWTFIGESDSNRQRLELSRESAQRLVTALTAHLRMLDEGPGRHDPFDATHKSVD